MSVHFFPSASVYRVWICRTRRVLDNSGTHAHYSHFICFNYVFIFGGCCCFSPSVCIVWFELVWSKRKRSCVLFVVVLLELFLFSIFNYFNSHSLIVQCCSHSIDCSTSCYLSFSLIFFSYIHVIRAPRLNSYTCRMSSRSFD